jgi:hypothetical protein
MKNIAKVGILLLVFVVSLSVKLSCREATKNQSEFYIDTSNMSSSDDEELTSIFNRHFTSTVLAKAGPGQVVTVVAKNLSESQANQFADETQAIYNLRMHKLVFYAGLLEKTYDVTVIYILG